MVQVGKERGPLIGYSEASHMDLIYLAIAAVFFLLSGWLLSALERL